MDEQPFDVPEHDAGTEAPSPEPEPSLLHALKSWLVEVAETVLPAIVIAVLINLFLAQATRVYGSSMEPNLHTDQRLVVEKVSYRLHEPRRGDVIVLRMPERGPELLIKRVIALPGETIEIREGTVYVNGTALQEPYLSRPTNGTYGPTHVPEGQLFVMGDNRGASNDSRVFGSVERERIIGHAWLSYWPLETIGLIH